MSLQWILDKPPALGLGPHPHLSTACSPSFFPSLPLSQTHIHAETPKALQTLCQFNKERLCHAYLSHSFLARVTTVWVSGKTGRGQLDNHSGQCVCVCLCLCVCSSPCVCIHSICVDPLRYVLVGILLNVDGDETQGPWSGRRTSCFLVGHQAVRACVHVSGRWLNH